MEPIKKSVNDYDNDAIKEEKLIKTNKQKVKYFFETLQETFKFPGWNKEECTKNKVNAILLKEFTKLVDDYENRMKAYKNDVKVFGSGFWYANDYLLALEEKNKKANIEWYKERNSFYHGFAPVGFNYVENKDRLTGFDICTYVLKQEITPSTGLKNCISSKACFIDCQSLIEIALYKTILKVIGATKFDSYFKKNPLRLDPLISKTPLEKFIQSSKSLSPGAMIYFANVPLYNFKHPKGESGGFHSLYKGEKKFIAFGLPAEGVNEEEMYQKLLDAFNSSPLDPKLFYSEKLIEKTEKNTLNDARKIFDNPEEFLKKVTSHEFSLEEFISTQQQSPDRVGLLKERIIKINIAALKELCAE